MQKRIMALLLAAAMATSMVACGSTEKPAETPSTPAAPTTPAAPAEKRDTFTMAISYMPDALSPIGNGSDD